MVVPDGLQTVHLQQHERATKRLPRRSAPWRRWDEAALRRNIGVYVHVPFCLHRCGYCDFLTFGDQRPPGLAPAPYSEALLAEIEARGKWARDEYGSAGRFVDSVFFGGGTPTYLAPEVLSDLVRAVHEHFPIAASGVEFTVEANPDTLNPDYIAALAEAGVNRLSLGIQSTHVRHLRRLERTHRFEDIKPVLRVVQRGPIRRYSFDLIYGLPDMTAREVRESIAALMQYSPEHISAYELIYEPGTPMHRWRRRFPGQVCGERQSIEQHEAIGRALRGYGLYRYEISNYARPGAECRHNLRYWRGGDYIGVGVGAASRLGAEVVNNPRGFEEYRTFLSMGGAVLRPSLPVDSPGLSGSEGRSTAPSLLDAPPADLFLLMRTRAGAPAELLPRPDPHWLTRGWLHPAAGQLAVTNRGLRFADLFAKSAWPALQAARAASPARL